METEKEVTIGENGNAAYLLPPDEFVQMKLYKVEEGFVPYMKVPGETFLDPMRQKILQSQLTAERIKQRENAKLTQLVERTGMPVTQENGQRRYGPPREYTGPPPPKGSEIFLGKIPRDAFEPELVPIFEKIGKIYEMRIMMDFGGTNRGYGFVQYYTVDDAMSAIRLLNNYEIRAGFSIGVVKSVDNCRLYVGGIPKTKTRDDIYTEMDRITEGVSRVILYHDLEDKSKNRGFGFVEYESHKAAAMARRKMLPGRIPMWGVNVTVDWARPERETFAYPPGHCNGMVRSGYSTQYTNWAHYGIRPKTRYFNFDDVNQQGQFIGSGVNNATTLGMNMGMGFNFNGDGAPTPSLGLRLGGFNDERDTTIHSNMGFNGGRNTMGLDLGIGFNFNNGDEASIKGLGIDMSFINNGNASTATGFTGHGESKYFDNSFSRMTLGNFDDSNYNSYNTYQRNPNPLPMEQPEPFMFKESYDFYDRLLDDTSSPHFYH